MQLQDKAAIVTGAASGIGRAIARAFAAEGAGVIVADIRDTPISGGIPTQDLIAQARGRLINVSSQHGMIASPGYIAYGTSKAGVVYITGQIAADYAKQGIICNAIAPGKILTGNSAEEQNAERMATARARTPIPRLGRPDDVAGAAVFLASEQASYITGVNLMVDGGWMAA